MKWRAPASAALKSAILASFCEEAPVVRRRFAVLSTRDWQGAEYWLYASGLSLYFLDRVVGRGLWDVVPAAIFSGLRKSQIANSRRSRTLFEEFKVINGEFLAADIHFANLKGFTLCPDSCPRFDLRHQIDLDFLVDRERLNDCRQVLESLGYRLDAATPATWEFKAGGYSPTDVKDRYEATRYRAAELHFRPEGQRDPRLDRLATREIAGIAVPTLAPPDQLIGQALHLLGHLRGESTRASWLWEFRRHVQSRRGYGEFWSEVRRLVEGEPLAQIALGMSVMVAEELFGAFAHAEMDEWTIHVLPPKVALWARGYGRTAVVADFPGTKLCLLLEKALAEKRGDARTSTLRRLLPIHGRPRILSKAPGETRLQGARRNVVQAKFFLFRLRFHLVEGLRYLLELPRWRRQASCIAAASDVSRAASSPGTYSLSKSPVDASRG